MSTKVALYMPQKLHSGKGVPVWHSPALAYFSAVIKRDLPQFEVVYNPPVNTLSPGDWALITSVTQNYNAALELGEQLHKQEICTVIGGPHFSALPNLENTPFDFGVIGEGELAVLKILCGDHAPGIVKEEQIEDLDWLPIADRGTIGGYKANNWVNGSRGCPFKCAFCSSRMMWGRTRYFSPQRVIEEAETIIGHSPYLYFVDDNFTQDADRFIEICDLMEQRQFKKKFSQIYANIRADAFRKIDILPHLRRAGFKGVAIGMESGSNNTLKKIRKGVTVEKNQETIDRLHKGGIGVVASFVTGMPDETKEEIESTKEFLVKNKEKWLIAVIYPVMPFPGTELWDIAKKDGLVSEDMNWDLLNADMTSRDWDWDKYIILSDKLTKEDLQSVCAYYKRGQY